MNFHQDTRTNRIVFGFSRTEVWVVLLVAIFLGGVMWAYVISTRRLRSPLSCSQNLKQLGLAARLFADDHNNLPPWDIPTNQGGTLEFEMSGEQVFRHFQAQSNFVLTARLLICPQDTRRVARSWETLANTNVSYFVGLDSKPSLGSSIVSGDRNITSTSAIILERKQSTSLSWIKSLGLHGDRGHIVFGDGHVEELDSKGLINAVEQISIATNRFAVP